MQNEAVDGRLTEAQLDEIEELTKAASVLAQSREECFRVEAARRSLLRVGGALAPRMARELRRLYDIEGANILNANALWLALECERVLQVEAEQLRAELARANRQSDDGILGEGGVSQWG